MTKEEKRGFFQGLETAFERLRNLRDNKYKSPQAQDWLTVAMEELRQLHRDSLLGPRVGS